MFHVRTIVGAAISRPQRNGTARLVEWHAIRTHCRGGSQPPAFVPGQKCSVEWYHVRHSTNSPKLIRYCRFVLRGRLRASPTVLSWCCGNSPNPVHHFWLVLRGRLVAAPTVAWMSFVPAKLQFIELWPFYPPPESCRWRTGACRGRGRIPPHGQRSHRAPARLQWPGAGGSCR